MRRATTAFVTIVSMLVSLAGCDEGTCDDGLDGAERAALDTAVGAIAVVAGTLSAAHALLDLEAITPGNDAEPVATAMEEHAQETVGECASVSRQGSSVAVDLGAAPGCELPDGRFISGRIEVDASASPEGAGAVLTLTDVAIDGVPAVGSLEVSSTAEGRHVASLDLESGGLDISGSVHLSSLAVGLAMTGELTTTTGDGVVTSRILGIHQEPGACWPGAGTAEIEQPPIAFTVVFDETSAESGLATFTRDDETPAEVTLPHRDECALSE